MAILLFLDYLLRIVDQSRTPFSLAAFVARLLDPDFVPKERYAMLLVKELPPKHRLATCRDVFARRAEGDAKKLRVFFDAVFSVMSLDERAELCELLSVELRQTDDEETIRFVLGAFAPDLWPRLDELARLRIENKLIGSVRDGKWIERQNRCTGGALGTWATSIIHQFTLKDELWYTIINKLGSSNTEEQDYVFNYFVRYADACLDAPSRYLISVVKKGLKAGDARFKTAVRVGGKRTLRSGRRTTHGGSPLQKPSRNSRRRRRWLKSAMRISLSSAGDRVNEGMHPTTQKPGGG